MATINRVIFNHFNSLANDYDKMSLKRAKYLNGIDDLILNRLQKTYKHDIRMLDVGCGTGRRTEKYKLKLDRSVIYGCDLSPRMIKIAQTKQIDKVILSDMSMIQLQNESFDVILCLFNTFGYLVSHQQRLQTLINFNKMLKVNGYLFLDVMNRWHTGEGLNYKKSIFSLCKENIKSMLSSTITNGDKIFLLSFNGKKVDGWVHGFSNSEMRLLLKKSGFSVKEVLYVGYDTGQIKKYFWEGQLFYVCTKY
jgi:ubiquinone/menaquinone biosynthesis C-methylase UbiE